MKKYFSELLKVYNQNVVVVVSAFYETSIARKSTVQESFDNSVAELFLENDDFASDCCCQHEEH